MPGADGPRLVSSAAADAVKAAAWAIGDCRRQPPPLVVLTVKR